jgi:hypothetical protein
MGFKEISTGLAIAVFASAALAEDSWVTHEFDMPESAIVDAAHNRIILSEMVGNPAAADGTGRLVLLSNDGAVLNAAWTTSLDAPKGMGIIGDTLLVADLTRLHVIDLATGTIRGSITAPGAVFLNDVTAEGTVAYISDMMTDSIWRYANGSLTLWLHDPKLSHPNGLLLDGKRLLVGSWGAGLRDDFTTEVPGTLLSVALDSKEISTLAPNVGNIDGIAQIGDRIIVSDWVTGGLIEVGADGTAQQIAQYAPGLADIAAQGDRLLLPMMLDGTLMSVDTP